MTKRQEITEIAQTWLGTPFHHEARVKGHGVDCLQLLIGVYQEAGLLPADLDVEHYAHDEHLHNEDEKYLDALEAHGLVETDNPQPGDIAMFRIGRRYSHAAIVIEYPLCIHSYIRQGVMFVDAVNDAELANRVRRFYTAFKDEA